MAFTPEDGTGLSDANSYVTIAYADEYFLDRNETSWASATSATQEASLIKGTDYIESRYKRVQGQAVNSTQALMFPAYGMINDDGNIVGSDSVPVEIKQACCILALEVLNGVDINAAIERTTSEEKAGPVQVKYSDSSAPETLYAQVNGLVSTFLSMLPAYGGQGRLNRG